MANLCIEYIELVNLAPFARNARIHSRKQIRQIADSIKTFGFTNPIIVDKENTILAGHGRLAAARELGLAEVPLCEDRDHVVLSEASLCPGG